MYVVNFGVLEINANLDLKWKKLYLKLNLKYLEIYENIWYALNPILPSIMRYMKFRNEK